MSARRSFTAEFKVKVVLELISGAKSLAQASRENGIKDTVLSRWKQEFLANATQLFEQPKEVQWAGRRNSLTKPMHNFQQWTA